MTSTEVSHQREPDYERVPAELSPYLRGVCDGV